MSKNFRNNQKSFIDDVAEVAASDPSTEAVEVTAEGEQLELPEAASTAEAPAPEAAVAPEGMRMLRTVRFPMHDGGQSVTFVESEARQGLLTNWVKCQLAAGLLVDETPEAVAA